MAFGNSEGSRTAIVSSQSIYADYKGFTLWKSDWLMIQNAQKQKIWSDVPEKNLEMAKMNRAEIDVLLANQDLKTSVISETYNRFWANPMHTTAEKLVEFSIEFWRSREGACFFGNRFYNHLPFFDRFREQYLRYFDIFLPFDGECVFPETFHKGIVTNFRIFYEDEKGKICVIPNKKIRSYQPEPAKMFGSDAITVILIDDSSLRLALEGTLPERNHTGIVRINEFLNRKFWEIIPKEKRLLLSMDKTDTDKWWKPNPIQ